MRTLSAVMLAAVDNGTRVKWGEKVLCSDICATRAFLSYSLSKRRQKLKILPSVHSFYEKGDLYAHRQLPENYRKQLCEVQRKAEESIEKKKSIGRCEPSQIRKRVRYNIKYQEMHLSVWKYTIHTVYLLHVSVTHVANFREVGSRVQNFPAWHTKAAPSGKCCEGYIVPSMVRLMYQLKSVLK